MQQGTHLHVRTSVVCRAVLTNNNWEGLEKVSAACERGGAHGESASQGDGVVALESGIFRSRVCW